MPIRISSLVHYTIQLKLIKNKNLNDASGAAAAASLAVC